MASHAATAAAVPTVPAARSMIYLSMDVHKDSVTIAVLPPLAKAPTRLEQLANDLPTRKKGIARVARDGEIHAWYDASGAGEVLHRAMAEWGDACDVIAPSLIPTRSGVHRTHDQRDDAEHTVTKLQALPLPAHVLEALAPLIALWGPLQTELEAADERLVALAKANAAVTRLRTMPSIGPVTALAFVASLDDVTRFHSAHQVQAYLGLVPSEYSSGDRRLRGRITTRGDARMRWLLVETAWCILRSANPELAALKAWGDQIAERRGKRIATVALARRVGGILYAMWRDDVDYAARTRQAVAA